MEKHRPHYPLAIVRSLISTGRVRATVSAFSHAQMIGVHDLAGMCSVIMSLVPANFYKSMTTHADHRIWQDVYHATTPSGDPVYLKLTVLDEVLIISFKEL